MPRVRGSRAGQRPASTRERKSPTAALNRSGSSKFTTWPVLGNTTRPEAEIASLRNKLGSMQRSSSSPTTISAGTLSFLISASKS